MAEAAPAAPPQLTKLQAAEILDKVIAAAKDEALVKDVKGILDKIAEEHKDDPMAQQMQKTAQLMPLAMKNFGPVIKSYGFDESTLLMGLMQVQMLSMGDAELGPKAQTVAGYLAGNFPQ